MYHPFYSRTVLGIMSLSDYHHAKSQIAALLSIIQWYLFVIGYEKIIELWFKKSAKKNNLFLAKVVIFWLQWFSWTPARVQKMMPRRPSIACIDYLATKYFRKRMKLADRNSNTYVGCLVSMFWQETYLNKEILWFSPLSRVLVRTVYEAFFFSLTLFKLCFLIQCFFLFSFSQFS